MSNIAVLLALGWLERRDLPIARCVELEPPPGGAATGRRAGYTGSLT
jgi:hypothetical protein